MNHHNHRESRIEYPVIYVPIRHLYICREPSTNQLLFMQNKPNFQKSQMNVNILLQMAYENKRDWTLGENKPKQTQPRNNSYPYRKFGPSLLARTYDKMVKIDFNHILVRINEIYVHLKSCLCLCPKPFRKSVNSNCRKPGSKAAIGRPAKNCQAPQTRGLSPGHHPWFFAEYSTRLHLSSRKYPVPLKNLIQWEYEIQNR